MVKVRMMEVLANNCYQDKLELHARRFEEGYDIFLDSDYISWLKLYHPESLPPENDLSLTETFPSVIPETPISVVGEKQQSMTSHK